MANLQFQSFTNQNFEFGGDSSSGGAGSGGGYSGKIGDSTTDDNATGTAGPKKNFFSFGFYQQYFDVDTEQVTKRLINSAIPTQKNFITEFVQPVPDLYGPFWVCITLVFSIGIFSNIAQFIENRGAGGEYGSDFRMVTGASSLIASYVILVPFVLYSLLWYRKADIQYSFVELLCTYGYSLAIFIPVSMLWTIDVNWLRWALIFAAVALSGSVLVRAIYPAIQNDPNKLLVLGVAAGVIVLHFGLAICFKEYFFDPATSNRVSPVGPPMPPHVDPTQGIPELVTLAANNSIDNAVKKPESANQVAAPAGAVHAANGNLAEDVEKAEKEEKEMNKTSEDKKEEKKSGDVKLPGGKTNGTPGEATDSQKEKKKNE